MKAIVVYPNDVLTTPCERVEKFDADLRELVAEMFETMYAAHGVGLAANQIGVNKRVAVIDVGWTRDGKHPIVLINPEIFGAHGDSEPSEGCLSVPEFRERRHRNVSVSVRAQDMDGKPFTLCGTWLLAQAIQHECDHLDGRLCLSEYTLNEFLKSQKETLLAGEDSRG